MVNSRKLTKVLALTLCLLAIVASGTLAGCQSTAPTIDEFTLTGLWEKAAAATGVQEASAQLVSLELRIEADESVIVQSLVFSGQNEEGQLTLYLVSTNIKGKIQWYYSERKSVTTTRHPLSVFEEIDKLGLPAIPRGDNGCNLDISFEYGSAHYWASNVTLYELNDGQLLPLEEILFDSDAPWAKITVSPMYIVEEGVDEKGNYIRHSSASLDGQCMEQLWFLAADMSKATNIEYPAD